MAIEALVQDDTETPLVAPCIIFTLANYFRCHVLARANHRPSCSAVTTAVTPVEQRFLAMAARSIGIILALMLPHTLRHIPGPFYGASKALRPILGITLNGQTEFMDESVAMSVIVASIMRPVAVECKTKVGDLEMSGRRHEEIIWLNISMDAA